MSTTLEEAYRHCEVIARKHYENFPIGWFIPKKLRKHIYAVYAFARTADDIVDEPCPEGTRESLFQAFENKLEACLRGEVRDPLFLALSETIHRMSLPTQLLKNLLKAFRQDLTKTRYQSYRELEDYCVYSANPIGRIVLHLYGYEEPQLLTWSDRICTGIQLVNHWQDVAVDLDKDRIYLPLEDMKKFGCSVEDLKAGRHNSAFMDLMRFETARARSLFMEGKPLLKALEGRLRWQIALMWLGPMKILEKLEEAQYNVFQHRPKIKKSELMKLVLQIPRFR